MFSLLKTFLGTKQNNKIKSSVDLLFVFGVDGRGVYIHDLGLFLRVTTTTLFLRHFFKDQK